MILADEPTGNLDSDSSKEIMNLIRSLHGKGRTVILVTHDISIARYADRIISLKDGRVDREEKVAK
jgi:ABC-type lipoprotein export system ATPase subunit